MARANPLNARFGKKQAMRALICEKLGGPEQLRIVELPIPQPKMGEILVRVRFAALNFFDSLIIQGRYQQKPEMPFSPSAEFAGEVVAGEGWAKLKVSYIFLKYIH